MEENNQNQQIINETMQNPTGKSNLAKKSIAIAIIFILLLVGFGLFQYFSSRQVTKKEPLDEHMGMVMPEKNIFYSATYHGSPVIYYLPTQMAMDETGKRAMDAGIVIEYLLPYTAAQHNQKVSFADVQNPQKLFSFEDHATIINYVVSSDKTYLMISFVGGKSATTGYIYQVNLKTRESKKIWQHELRSGESPYNSGFAYVTQFIPDRYVVFAFYKTTPTPADLSSGVIIKNIPSGKENILGTVGAIQIDPANSTVSYKKLEQVRVPCEKKDPVCFATDTYKLVYEATGEALTQPLP